MKVVLEKGDHVYLCRMIHILYKLDLASFDDKCAAWGKWMEEDREGANYVFSKTWNATFNYEEV